MAARQAKSLSCLKSKVEIKQEMLQELAKDLNKVCISI
jgi:hypothetical protein